MWIDIHCHLDGEEYEELGGGKAVIRQAKEDGVGIILLSGSDYLSAKKAKELCEGEEGVYFCAGFHPGDLKKWQAGDWERLEELAKSEKCVAIGEIGLDYHFDDNPSKEEQKEAFRLQIAMAKRLGLPIVVHSRDACQDTLTLLKEEEKNLCLGGLMHCYSYSPECVAEFERLGFYFSFGGTSTFKNAKKVRESVCAVSISRSLSETDSPYLSPEPYRGKFPNIPSRIRYTVENMAKIRGENLDELQSAIEQNAKRLFPKIKR